MHDDARSLLRVHECGLFRPMIIYNAMAQGGLILTLLRKETGLWISPGPSTWRWLGTGITPVPTLHTGNLGNVKMWLLPESDHTFNYVISKGKNFSSRQPSRCKSCGIWKLSTNSHYFTLWLLINYCIQFVFNNTQVMRKLVKCYKNTFYIRMFEFQVHVWVHVCQFQKIRNAFDTFLWCPPKVKPSVTPSQSRTIAGIWCPPKI